MKLVFSSLALCLLIGLNSVSAQITCFQCTATFLHNSGIAAADACFAPVAGTGSAACGTTAEYCRTTITLRDGLISAIVRDCADPATDHDSEVTTMPEDDCSIDLNLAGSDIDTTTCYKTCNTNECNTDTDTTLTPCPNACANGYCNYITGTCVCPSTHTGTICDTAVVAATATFRSCAQCNSEVDGTACSSGTIASTPCLQDDTTQAYCAYTTTNVLSGDEAVKTTVTRGCAIAADYTHRDECFFSVPADTVNFPSPTFREYTCAGICDTDGCNMATAADGLVVAPEAVGLYCVVCSDTSGAGSCNTMTTRTLCPSGSTHCSHTVSYYLSARTDVTYSAEAAPGYQLLSVERTCASAEVEASCTSVSVTGALSSLQRVTCTETCSIDGCNTGWPNRPKCVQCQSDFTTDINDGYDACLSNPPLETDCTLPYEGNCVTIDHRKSDNSARNQAGFLRFVRRGCSYASIGSVCASQSFGVGQSAQSCNYTCTTDGCNQGVFGVVAAGGLSAYQGVPMFSLTIGLLSQLLFKY